MTEQRVLTITQLMRVPERIRNFSIIAHIDHGKTTLVDSLLAKGALLRTEDIGVARSLDTKPMEKEKGITISSTVVTVAFNHKDTAYLINLVDSPGHVDFNGEVSAALRVTDGALVVVDLIERVSVQTETVVRQALAEHIRPVLHINKLDRGLLEMHWTSEEMYQNMARVVEDVNVVLATYRDEVLGDVSVDPLAGSVSFGSGKQGWAFTLPQFARIYAARTGMPVDRILKRLWGDHFYDPETKKFVGSPKSASGKTLPRFFCQVVMDPLIRVFSTFGPSVSIDAPRDENMDKVLKGIGVTISPSKWNSFKSSSDRIKHIMQTWLPAGDALTELVVEHLPSPKEAQKYRAEALYTGPMDSEVARAVRDCDPNGPLIFFVSKMVPTRDEKRMLCFGRVFSGTMRAGAKVRVLGPGYNPENTHHTAADLVVDKAVQRINIQIRFDNMESIEYASAGNLVAVMGLDSYIQKTATITDNPDAHVIRSVKFSVSPVVAVAVEPKSASDLPKLIDALRHLAKANQMLRITTSDKGENIIAGVGELHLEVALEDLKELLGRDIQLVISRPVVDFCETVTTASSITTVAKSVNKHNRVHFTAEPLPAGMCSYAQQCSNDTKERLRLLCDKYPESIDMNKAKKIWFFGPEEDWQNMLTESTVGVQLIHNIKDSVRGGFQAATAEGVLCGEPLRDVAFHLVDATIHPDNKHAGFGQIMPAARRAMQAAQLVSNPRLMEPIYLVDIQAPIDCSGAIHNVLSKRRGFIVSSDQRIGSPIVSTKAHLPVAESFGFVFDLREATGGRAFPSMSVDHWSVIDDDPFQPGTISNKIVKMIRERKGLPPDLPKLEKFDDSHMV